MGKAITVAILAAVLAFATPLVAHAAGLGKLNVLSSLGQPLNAEIEIVALRPGEEEGLAARVASPEAFAAAGIEMGSVLSGMRFAVERRGNQRVLRVTTSRPVNEPFVEFLVELQWGTGRLVREYTFLLDPPEYKARDSVAAALAPAPKPAAPVEPAKPASPAVEAKPIEPSPAPPVISPTPIEPPKEPAATQEPAKEAAQAPAKEAAQEPAKEPAKEAAKEAAKPAAEAKAHEVKQGDTLGGIARANLPPGVSLNQMLVALYRANQDAFIRENVNLVRAGRILHIPTAEEASAVPVEEANALVSTHMAEFREYRSRLAAVATPADASAGQRETTGAIEPKPAAPKPAAPQDQVRLSKAEPQKPGAAGARAAREDDLVARERALKEAQSRITDLEKNVADLQKLLELKNQQLAELEKKAGAAKPAPAAPAPAAKAPEKPAAKAPEKPAVVAEAPKPAPAPAPTPAPAAKAPDAAKAPEKPAPKPAAKPAPKGPPPPAPSLLDEFLGNPIALAGLGGLVVLLLAYGAWAWRKKKAVQTRFHDSVTTAAAAGAAAGASISEPTLGGTTPATAQSGASQPPAAMAAEEVDPIAEADVYMAYGRDSQAEEILKEALQKDSNRAPVHGKLLEIYAKRKDTKAFEQTALKLKNITGGTGPEWDKAASLGHSIDPQNGLYAGAAANGAAAPAAAPAAPAPTLDFDIGGGGQAAAPAPDLALDAAPKAAAPEAPLDFDIGGGAAPEKKDVSQVETMVPPELPKGGGGLDFNLDLGNAPAAPAAENKAEPAPAAPADAGLTFDLNLDLGTEKKPGDQAAAAPDLGSISLDLGGSPATSAPAGADPKWQEIATKLDLAKAYEEMGDKAGARELLNEVMKDGDAAQKGQAQQLLAKLG